MLSEFRTQTQWPQAPLLSLALWMPSAAIAKRGRLVHPQNAAAKKPVLPCMSYCFCRVYDGIYLNTIAHSQKEGTHSLEYRMIHCGREKVMTKTTMVIVMVMMIVIDGDGDTRLWWWWWRWNGCLICDMVLKMLHWWYVAVINMFIKFDLDKQS